jgi:hypothetical protein
MARAAQKELAQIMAFTQTQLDALEAAIAAGVKVYHHEGKRVEYQTLDEMLKVREIMRADLGLVANDAPRHSTAAFYR